MRLLASNCSVRAASGANAPAAAKRQFGLRSFREAFTLMEIMIVVAIMAIVMATGLPLVMKARKREPLNQSTRDIVEVLSNARAFAILQGNTTEVVINPREKRFQVSGGGAGVARQPSSEETTGFVDPSSTAPPTDSGLSAQVSERVVLSALGINLVDYSDAEFARVRFYPNGTCDELLLVLTGDNGDQNGVSLEVTTSLASVIPQNELQKLVERLR